MLGLAKKPDQSSGPREQDMGSLEDIIECTLIPRSGLEIVRITADQRVGACAMFCLDVPNSDVAMEPACH